MPHQTNSFSAVTSSFKSQLISRFTLLIVMSILASGVQAAEINTKLPKETDGNSIAPISIDLPAQPLDVSLQQFARSSGVSLSFDTNLARNKKAPAVKGRMTRKEVLQRLLAGSGLEANIDGDNAIVKPATDKDALLMQLESVNVRAKRFYEVGPLPGLGLTLEQIPGNVQSISAKEIKEARALSLTELMNNKLQSVNVNDYQGNPFQMDVTYRGFTAGPQIGTPQGLSVFFDGVRVNEPFGDVVNWDMIPMNALAGVDVFPGSNPIFGLNTLGGAFAMKTKDGFNNTGVDADVLTGSFGRKQLQVSSGWNNGTIGLFGAGNFFLEDGWRENSPSKVNQLFGKASYRGEKLDLNLSTLIVQTDLVGNGLIPSEMYAQNRNGSFTSEDTTKNQLLQFQLSGSYFVSDTFTVTGQVYRRSSKRHQMGADAYIDYDDNDYVARKLNPGENYTCLYNSNNANGLPNYYVVDLVDPNDANQTPFFANYNANGAVPDFTGLTLNPVLPDPVLNYVLQEYRNNQNYAQTNSYKPQGGSVAPLITPPPSTYTNSGGDLEYNFDAGDSGFIQQRLFGALPGAAISQTFYWTADPNNPGAGIKHAIILAPPINTCIGGNSSGQNSVLIADPNTGAVTYVDGANNGTPGVVKGTPTAVLTDNRIDQITEGASVQLNWNLEHHKFMVGAAIDKPTAEYSSGQKLGLLDASRNAYLAPDQIREQYAAASIAVHNNDFSGESTTKSIYASETWSPTKTLHISSSVRYNDTHGFNKIASRSFGFSVLDLAKFGAFPDSYGVCVNGVCPTTGYKLPDLSNLVNPPETEKFSYFSLNPSLGVSWQAKEDLNIYGNLSQGTRTPSVIELGCALDRTPVVTGYFPDGSPKYTAKGVAENRSCSLPSTLSGDPYLPQIKATTYDFGLRGQWGSNIKWNLGAYQTDLKNDIYFVAMQDGRGFFDSIGDTRRRGIEAGISGTKDKWRFGLNYGLTEATFQNDFLMFSADNSSAKIVNGLGEGVIEVKPGSKMPGVPLHNLNANLNYDITSQWSMGISAVLHSESFVRGNENNEHEAGVVKTRQVIVTDPITNVPSVVDQAYRPTSPGKIAGYTSFNFRTSYKFNKEWTATMLINNLFDKEYFSAGRLGRNPFSPSILGAIGPDGYNHNSSDWQSTNFIAPGAPRGIWFSLNWQFDASK
jgi:outer membrane receptor protein involved in Fe transport